MIWLDVEPYCNDCEDFTPEVERLYADGKIYMQTVRCQYHERCRRIYEAIRKEVLE